MIDGDQRDGEGGSAAVIEFAARLGGGSRDCKIVAAPQILSVIPRAAVIDGLATMALQPS